MTGVHRPRVMRWLGLVAAAWCGILLLRATPVGGDWLPISIGSWLAMLGWLAAYMLGFTLFLQATIPPRMSAPEQIPLDWWIRWIRRLCLLAIVGAGLIVIEFAVVRGYGFSTPVALIRVAEVEGAVAGFGGSAISGAGRLLTPALQVAWILAVVRWGDLRAGIKALVLLATVVVLLQQAMYEGGRFFLATLVASGFVARSMIGQASRRGRAYGSLRTVVISVAVLGAFGFVFLDRVAAFELDLTTAYLIYTRGFAVMVGPEVVARLESAAGPLWFAASMFWMYITQGPNELAVLLDQEGFMHAFGLFQFPQLGQALSKLTGAGVRYDVFSYLENAGVYATSVGAGYIDFGLAGAIVFASVLGAITAAATRAIETGRINALGLSAPLLVVLGVFSPIISLVTNLWPAILWALLVGVTVTSRSTAASGRDICHTT